MHLFEVALLAAFACPEGGGFGAVRLAVRQRAKAFLGKRHQFPVVDAARSGQHHARREITLAHIALQLLAAEAGYGIHRTEDRAPKRLIPISRFQEIVENDVVRRVMCLADLGNDDATLALDLFRVEH